MGKSCPINNGPLRQRQTFTDTVASGTLTYLGWQGVQPFASLNANLPTGRATLFGPAANARMDPDLSISPHLAKGSISVLVSDSIFRLWARCWSRPALGTLGAAASIRIPGALTSSSFDPSNPSTLSSSTVVNNVDAAQNSGISKLPACFGRVSRIIICASSGMNPTLIIMPTYNERENLPRMAERLLKLPVPVDLLVVDDNSPDGTGKMADELAAKHPEIHVLHRAEKERPGPRLHCRVQMGAGAQLRIHFRDGRRFFAQPGRRARRSSKPPRMPTWCSARVTTTASASSTGR